MLIFFYFKKKKSSQNLSPLISTSNFYPIEKKIMLRLHNMTLGELTKFETISTIDVKVVVTRFTFVAERIENKAIGTQPFFSNTIIALVVSITLPAILKGTIRLGTFKLGCQRIIEN